MSVPRDFSDWLRMRCLLTRVSSAWRRNNAGNSSLDYLERRKLIYLYIYSLTYLHIYLHIYLLIYLHIYLHIYLLIYLHIYLHIYLLIYLHIYSKGVVIIIVVVDNKNKEIVVYCKNRKNIWLLFKYNFILSINWSSSLLHYINIFMKYS